VKSESKVGKTSYRAVQEVPRPHSTVISKKATTQTRCIGRNMHSIDAV